MRKFTRNNWYLPLLIIGALCLFTIAFGQDIAPSETSSSADQAPPGTVPASPEPAAPEPKPPPPPKPYKVLFFENDFRYLDRPGNTFFDPFDALKRIRPHSDLVTDVGGEFRWQGKVEHNRRLNGLNDTYNLFRDRLYIDTWYKDDLRFYVEFIDSISFNEDLPPLLIDENRADLQNIFGEIRLWSEGDASLSFRYGRQELLYGDQRLISPLDWANTRRNFDEVAKLFYRSKEWDMDGFWGRPIVPDPHNFDHGDQSRQFGGAYAVYKGIKDQTVDAYFLTLLESDDVAIGQGGVTGDFEAYTVGSRWKGNWCDWLWDVEGAYQFGHHANLDRHAGMVTVGAGRRFPDWWAKPEIWVYYDWASGDDDPNDGEFNTFNQLFPLGHKYFGILDIVARQNIRDPNVLLLLNPHPRVKIAAWYHHFTLDERRDGLFNAAGLLTRRDATGRAGRDVGDEIDVVVDFMVNAHADFQIGYGHFEPGSFIDRTGSGGDADFFYTQFVFRF